MSWDIYLKDPVSKEVITLPFEHHMYGGTYRIGGTNELWLNVTYNYGKVYREKTNGLTLDYLDNKIAYDTIDFFEGLIKSLSDDVSDDYWEATEGNAKKAIYQLLIFARMRPDGIWEVS